MYKRCKKKKRRSFFLAEIIVSFSLLVCTMIPCLRFYRQMECTLEKKLMEMQLPALVDTAFFLVQQDLRDPRVYNSAHGSDVVDRNYNEGGPCIYSSSGKRYDVACQYSARVKKSAVGPSGGAKLFVVDVILDIPSPFNERVEAQRLVCVVY
ncbi:hypothetical protein [Chlamydiifrater volucris]|uniref:hypothetical protein n=1 Tax=Chlamydiifrater volucris TaxID=2681470 RepID=UPI001BCE0C4C|nr:hypothetical protein [Chlamydiifrater volucris]